VVLAELFSDLVRYETRLYNGLGHRLRDAHGISIGQYELLRLAGERGDLRVVDIAREFAIAVGAASKGVDRMEEAGWLRRRPNPSSRRSSLISLTDAGDQVLEAASRTFVDGLRDYLASRLTPSAIGDLAATLAMLRSELEAGEVGLPTG